MMEPTQLHKGDRVQRTQKMVEERRRIDLAQLSWLIRQYPERAKELVEKYVSATV